ncbi:MAG: phosphatase PAP2 family protein [Vicinamibacterales bacterium]
MTVHGRRERTLAGLLVLGMTLTGTPAAAQAPAGGPTTPLAGPPAATAPTWSALWREVGSDFRRVLSGETAVILGVAGGLSAAAHPLDEHVTARAGASTTLDRTLAAGAVGGGGLVQAGGAMATYVLGRALDRPRLAGTGADLVGAQIVATAITHGIKVSVQRRRPDGGRFSFPSGHTASTVATAAVLQRHYGWKAGLPAFAFGAYVAGSRLQDRRHYLSDVLFGAGIGLVSGRSARIGHGRGAGSVSPMAVPGGIGVVFTSGGAS